MLVFKVHRVLRVILELLVLKAFKVCKAPKAIPELLVWQAQSEIRVQ